MREIKFRVFIEDEVPTMLYSENDQDDELLERWIIGDNIHVQIREIYWATPGGNDPMSLERWINPKQHLMQFIGLKDKKGADIYEGDIIKFQKSETKYIVVWNHDGWIGISMDGDKYGAFTKRIYCNTINSQENHMPIVIGNVHENPELL